MIELALWALLDRAPADTPLARCRAESEALNSTRAIATCTAAGDDTAQPVDDRVNALRLLGMALMVEGDADLAEGAFEKMLALDPQAALGDDAGPAVQHVLSLARQKLADAAAAKEQHAPAVAPVVAAKAPAVAHDDTLAVTLVGAGGALALLAGVMASAATYDLYFHRVPCGAEQCVPFAPALFGIYPPQSRQQFFLHDGPLWVDAGVAAALAGLVTAGVGGALLFTE